MHKKGSAPVNDAGSVIRRNFPDRFLKKNLLFIAFGCFFCGYLFQRSDFVSFFLQLTNKITGTHLDYVFRLSGFNMMGYCLVLFGFLLSIANISKGKGAMLSGEVFQLISVIAIIIFYWGILLKNAVNVPITDDYYTVLNFLNTYIHQEDFNSKCQMIFAPYVETRNVTTKLLVLGSWKIFGFVNFKWLIISVNIALTGTAYLLYCSTDRILYRKLLIIPLLLFIFQFSFYDAQLWTTAGIHIVYTMFFSFLAFFLLIKDKNIFFCLSLFSAVIASFTYGNGLLTFPIGLFILIAEKRKMHAWIWGSFFLLLCFVYFNNYNFIGLHEGSFAYNPFSILLYCLAFWGSAFQFMYRLELPVLFGSLYLLFFIWLTKKKYYLLNPFNYAMLLFIFLSAVMASFFRIQSLEGINQALSNRYVIYSCMAVCCIFIALADMNQVWVKNSILVWLCFSASLYYLLSAFFFYPETEIRKQKLISFSEDLKSNREINFSPPVIPFGADTIFISAINNHIYHPWPVK